MKIIGIFPFMSYQNTLFTYFFVILLHNCIIQMRIPDFDDIFLSKSDTGIEDDTIVNEDPFAEVFGTPSMLRAPSIRRFSDEELEGMSIEQRRQIYQECACQGEIHALKDITTFNFKKYGSASLEYYLPALSYLYFRTEDTEGFEKLVQDYNYLIFDVDREILEVSEFMAVIGSVYPQLTPWQINKLEEYYNNPKYCEIVDDVLFDKELLPKEIKGISREDLSRKNTDFPDHLLDEIYQAFESNDNVDSDGRYTMWLVYVRRSNSIVRKQYQEIGTGECIIEGTIDSYYFFNMLEEKYGDNCLHFFVENIKNANRYTKDISFEDFRKWKSNWINFKIIQKISQEYNNNPHFLLEIRRLVALAYIVYLNR